MDDLVKRLRSGGETCGIDACKVRDAKSGCLCAIAADRIEALEAMLMRDQFAMAALPGVINRVSRLATESIADDCYKIADAMLKAREAK